MSILTTRDLQIFPDSLELGLLLGESALDEMAAHLQVRLGLCRNRAFALGLHRGQADAGLRRGVSSLREPNEQQLVLL